MAESQGLQLHEAQV